jgi:ribose/xylose/arabinose/galactoside ABC-type transport system permease subunit
MGALLGALMINLLQQSLLRWLVISNFWVDALLGLLILTAGLHRLGDHQSPERAMESARPGD